ncbi:carbohydrate kinase family protein [Stutzerimonas stutzeri]|uniref:carbohydrate kinase family protein n=1 Tax=Stutzerimonas stutzeri TaxID=316 RepID=UPI00210A5CAF|nr:carbohydrate kinase [Stutzerimonas stutzeri]MCQ4258280.1 carbohydrate kinase [Stutzerimonas stutzeri]
MYLVCGEALFDVFTAPSDTRSNRLDLEAVAGGSPFNVAVGLARLGAPVALLAGISTDPLGQRLRQVLEGEGVDSSHLVDFDAPTTLAMVALGADGAPVYSFRGKGCADRLLEQSHLRPLGDSVRGIHFGSYSLVTQPIADTLLSLLQNEQSRRIISLDPNIRLNVEPDLQRWRDRVETFAAQAHVIKVSDEDLALLYPGIAPEGVAKRWLAEQAEIVVLTRGSQGAQLFSRQHGQLHATAQAVTVRDTVGAGDTFQAALLTYLHEHELDTPQALAAVSPAQLEQMLRFAIAAAAITCSRRGPDLPYRYEID